MKSGLASQRHAPIETVAGGADWPRDFDIRAEFAEQQELLTPDELASSSNRNGTDRDE